MTNGTLPPPSAILGDTLEYPSAGVLLRIALPWMLSPPTYTDLPIYWTPRRDWALSATPKKEAMWANVVAIATTKFAAHGYTIRDAKDSQRKVSASQDLFKRADGGQGWVLFAQKVMRDMLTTDNGCFVRIRRDDDETMTIRVKEQWVAGAAVQGFADAQVVRSRPGAKISGLYHLDSLRCTRTGNLVYPVRYLPVNGTQQILRWDQVMMYADQPSPRAELFGVGECAADRAYATIAKMSAMEQLVFENLTGGGANKLALINGLQDQTLQGIIGAAHAEAQQKGLVYYLGTILGAVPGDAPLQLIEIRLKELLGSFVPKDERDNAYLIYAKACGIPQQDIQALSGQGLGTGTQTLVLDEAARGQGALPAFLKWWEQTVSDRILPATTELSFDDENDMRDQKMRAEVKKLRADTRAAQITSGEISPAIARQLAVDSEDIPQELVDDVTAGAQLSDDEKPQTESQPGQSPALLSLIQSEPTAPPKVAATEQQTSARFGQPKTKDHPGLPWYQNVYNREQAAMKAFWRGILEEHKAAGDPYLNEDPSRIDAVLEEWSGTPAIHSAANVADVATAYRLLEEERKRLGLDPVRWEVKARDTVDDLIDEETAVALDILREIAGNVRP